MVEGWLKTHDSDEVRAFNQDFWEQHRDDLESGVFWADRIKGLRGEAVNRLEMALDNLPLPGAFKEAAISLRAMIRECRSAEQPYGDELMFLYWLAAISSFSIGYSERAKVPGFNVISSVPGDVIKKLPFSYDELGYEKLELLKKTDIKWLKDAWGEPSTHTTLHQIHQDVWHYYEDEYVRAQKLEDAKLRRELEEILAPDSGPEAIGRRLGSAFGKLRKSLRNLKID